MAFIDNHPACREPAPDGDSKVEVSLGELEALVGRLQQQRLVRVFEASPPQSRVSIITLRRVCATGEGLQIGFHTDVSLKTMQVLQELPVIRKRAILRPKRNLLTRASGRCRSTTSTRTAGGALSTLNQTGSSARSDPPAATPSTTPRCRMASRAWRAACGIASFCRRPRRQSSLVAEQLKLLLSLAPSLALRLPRIPSASG